MTVKYLTYNNNGIHYEIHLGNLKSQVIVSLCLREDTIMFTHLAHYWPDYSLTIVVFSFMSFVILSTVLSEAASDVGSEQHQHPVTLSENQTPSRQT